MAEVAETQAVENQAGDDDRFPMLLARAWPVKELLETNEFDRWQGEKHLADLMKGEGAVKVIYFKTVYDELPQAYQGTGSIMAYYTARNIDGLYAWLNSEALRAGIEDGSRFFGKFNELDQSTYTGNVYRVSASQRLADEVADQSPVFIERFEVGDDAQADFDAWLHDRHLPEIASAQGVARARTFTAVRENIPISYYLSPGNRMLMTEFSRRENYRRDLTSNDFRRALADSMQWDTKLSYVRREAYEYANHAYSTHGGAY